MHIELITGESSLMIPLKLIALEVSKLSLWLFSTWIVGDNRYMLL